MQSRKKHSKKALKWIIISAVIAAAIASVLIVNVYFPLKYLSAYLIFGKSEPAEGQLRVRFPDVGYGNCAIVEFPDGKTALIDGGDDSYSSRLKIIKSLNESGTDKIDYLVCTSIKKEHCGGLGEILRLFDVDKIFAPYCRERLRTSQFAEFWDRAEGGRYDIIQNRYGAGFFNDDYGYSLYMLSPSSISSDGGAAEWDEACSAIWIEYAGQGILLLSDTTANEQAEIFELAAIEGGALNMDGHLVKLSDCGVVQVSSHGAEEAFRSEFYDLLSPQASIIQVGTNADGCPSDKVLGELARYGEIYSSDTDGDITVTIDGDGQIALSKEKK